jgi:hypothetical protein
LRYEYTAPPRLPLDPTPEQLREAIDRATEQVAQQSRLLSMLLNGLLTFGDGTDSDNIQGKWQSVSTPSTPGLEFAVQHDLGVVPVGFLILVPPVAGVINNGASSWTTTNIYLTCTDPDQTALIFLVTPPVQDL